MGGVRIYLASRALISLAWNSPAPCPLAYCHLLSLIGLVLKWCTKEACPAGTAPVENCWFWHSFSIHHISYVFSLIGFCLKSLPPQESAWSPPYAWGRYIVGLVLLSVRCAVNGHEAILYRDLGVNQFLVGWIVDNMNNPCFACTTLGAPGEVPHVQPQGMVLLVASPHTGYVYPAQTNLSVGSRTSQLIFSLLVEGPSLALCLVACTWASCPERCPQLGANWKESAKIFFLFFF